MKATSAVITIITTATCPHCLRLKHHLQNNISLTPLSTPYSEVQIDDSRIQKIQLLKKYTKGGASTVPQCFLGRHNLGGADDTIAMIQAIVSNIEADESISETLESRMLSSLSPDAYEEACTPFPLDEFMSVGSGDFEDSSAVTIDAAFVEENTKPKIGSSTPKSLKSKVFSNASRKINDSHSPIGLDYYDPATANSVVTALHQLVSTIIITHTDPATGNVDYLAAASDPNFTDIFVPATSLLKRIDLFSLKPEEKIPIVLNVYNLMCKHSFIHLGIPFKSLQRLQYFDYGLYLFNGGGVALSLNCLENGILRANRIAPYHLSKSIRKGWEPRLSLTEDAVDPRIHFGLNCGAKSCPPVKNYSLKSWDEELEAAAHAFLAENVGVDKIKNEVKLSMILHWYSIDFGNDKCGILERVYGFMGDGEKKTALGEILGIKSDGIVNNDSVKLGHFEYDWGMKISSCKKFVKGWGGRLGL